MSWPIQWYHSHADPICPDGTFNAAEIFSWRWRGGLLLSGERTV
jgi:hypothetical protein